MGTVALEGETVCHGVSISRAEGKRVVISAAAVIHNEIVESCRSVQRVVIAGRERHRVASRDVGAPDVKRAAHR